MRFLESLTAASASSLRTPEEDFAEGGEEAGLGEVLEVRGGARGRR